MLSCHNSVLYFVPAFLHNEQNILSFPISVFTTYIMFKYSLLVCVDKQCFFVVWATIYSFSAHLGLKRINSGIQFSVIHLIRIKERHVGSMVLYGAECNCEDNAA